MRYRILLGTWVLATATIVPAQNANMLLVQRLKSQPVVRVNGTALTQNDLLREMFTIFPYAKTHNGFPKAMEADIRTGALKMIEFEELVYQEGLRRKLTVPPAKFNQAMADFLKQFASQRDYDDYLTSEMNGSEDKLRTTVRRSLLIEQMLKSEVYDRAIVTMAEAKLYYDKNPDQFRVAESFTFQSISILPPANATPSQLKEASKRAYDALLKAKAAKTYNDFGLLAEKLSDDDYRVNMGDHHAVARAELPPSFNQTMAALQPGQTSGLIQVEEAYAILRLNSHVPAGMKPFDQVKEALRKQMEKNKTEHLRSSLDKRLRATAKVQEL